MTANFTPPPEREFPAARLQHRKEQLVAQIQRPQPPCRRRWTFAIGGTTAVAAAVIAVLALLPAGKPGGPSNAAAAVLLQAAHTAAARAPAAPPGPNQFIYTKIKAVWAGISDGLTKVHVKGSKRPRFVGPAHLVAMQWRPVTREDWIRPDGSGRAREVGGHLLFPRSADRAYAYKNYTRKYIDGYVDDWKHGPGQPNYNELTKLPTDPAQLKQLIESGKVESGSAPLLSVIGDLLRDTDAPPALRSALYTVASQLPGVLLIGPTHDQLGRPGIGVAYDSGGQREELIFDPQTSALLAEQTSVVRRSRLYPFRPGTLIGWTSYLASGVVDSDTATTTAFP